MGLPGSSSSALTRDRFHSSLSHEAGGTVVRGAVVCLMGLEPRGGKDVLKVTKGKLSLRELGCRVTATTMLRPLCP